MGAAGAGGPGAARRGAGVRVCVCTAAPPCIGSPHGPRWARREPRGLGGRSSLLLARHPGRDPGAQHKSRFSFSCGNVSASCAGGPVAPSPRPPPPPPGPSPPRSRRLAGSSGVLRTCPRGSLALTPHEGGEACSESCRRAEPVPFPEHSTARGWLGLCFLPPAPHVPIFILFLFALSLHFVSNS